MADPIHIAHPIQIAHQIQINDRVGGTLHIEPNDTPRAGELATSWFALIQAGGQSIPLEDCDCQLQLYPVPHREGDTAIAQPALQAIDVEGQRQVPAAEITFPQVGAYELVIQGRPRNGANFNAFELRFPVTVAAGSRSTPEPSPAAESPVTESPPVAESQASATQATQATSNPPRPQNLPGGTWGIGAAIGLGLMGWAIARLSQRKPS